MMMNGAIRWIYRQLIKLHFNENHLNPCERAAFYAMRVWMKSKYVKMCTKKKESNIPQPRPRKMERIGTLPNAFILKSNCRQMIKKCIFIRRQKNFPKFIFRQFFFSSRLENGA
jgi:hypothetical protein